jgi:Ca2+ transporting ATPase
VNSDAFPEKSEGKYIQIGNKTECALLEMALKLGYEYTSYRPSEKVATYIHIAPHSLSDA